MIHLMANNKQQQVPFQTQPPVQIPNPYYNTNNQKRNNSNNGKRQKRDDDWDICWDYLSPKGCNRDTCRWRHDNPNVDQQQIAKRRKQYMEQNRNNRGRHRPHNMIGPNRNRERKRTNNLNSAWQNMPPMPPQSMMQGPPPPPPYFAPPPPQMPPPSQQSQQSQPAQAQPQA
eukprot:131504_1